MSTNLALVRISETDYILSSGEFYLNFERTAWLHWSPRGRRRPRSILWSFSRICGSRPPNLGRTDRVYPGLLRGMGLTACMPIHICSEIQAVLDTLQGGVCRSNLNDLTIEVHYLCCNGTLFGIKVLFSVRVRFKNQNDP